MRWPPELKSPDGPLRLAIYERDGWRCAIRLPGCTVTPTQLDHIIDRQFGGALFDPNNLRSACESCNKAKSNPKGAPAQMATPVGPSREW